MYIDRDIDKTLLEWKHETSRKPLLVRGVRQCGKTSSVRNLAKTFKYYVEINLDKNDSSRFSS
jgi:predicted AAA+ superfamily ATPase